MKGWVYLLFLGVLAVWRLIELAISKRNARHHEKRFSPLPEPAFKWMVLLHTSMYILLPLELCWRQPTIGGWLMWSAITMTALAVLLRIWTLWHMGRSWNVRIIGGKDYPICSSGPYRWIRHPNYVVVVLEILWIPLIAGLWVSALLLTVANGVVLFFRIRQEEMVLKQNVEWVAKMVRKPRFVPFLF